MLSLIVASELGARSIAFPAISTGIYRYPASDAAQIAVTTIGATLAELPLAIELVRLVAFDASTYQLYRKLLSA